VQVTKALIDATEAKFNKNSNPLLPELLRIIERIVFDVNVDWLVVFTLEVQGYKRFEALVNPVGFVGVGASEGKAITT
jgi:hypothetical protein